jgi:negative regulator of sigma E activity
MTVENQTISALIDGEGSFSEGCAWIDETATGNEASRTAARYQMIGACMRGDAVVDTSGLFCRIHDRLQDEPTVLAPATMQDGISGTGRRKAVAGFAIAASLAAAVVFTLFRTQMPAETVVAESTPAADIRSFDAAPTLVANGATQSEPVQQAIRQVEIDTGNPDLDRYLRQHQDYAGSGAFGPGFTTATMVSYDGR